jgi:hypothetical protein
MVTDRKPRKWIYYFVPILSLILIIGLILLIPGIRNNLKNRLTNLIFGSPGKEENYDPQKDEENAKKVILDFYHAYQGLSPEKIISLTKEPLTSWELIHCENLRKQDAGYDERYISLDNLSFEFNKFNSNEAEINVKRLNVLKIQMPAKFGETTQGEMGFKLSKESGWKIINRTYNSLWVSGVY